MQNANGFIAAKALGVGVGWEGLPVLLLRWSWKKKEVACHGPNSVSRNLQKAWLPQAPCGPFPPSSIVQCPSAARLGSGSPLSALQPQSRAVAAAAPLPSASAPGAKARPQLVPRLPTPRRIRARGRDEGLNSGPRFPIHRAATPGIWWP